MAIYLKWHMCPCHEPLVALIRSMYMVLHQSLVYMLCLLLLFTLDETWEINPNDIQKIKELDAGQFGVSSQSDLSSDYPFYGSNLWFENVLFSLFISQMCLFLRCYNVSCLDSVFCEMAG